MGSDHSQTALLQFIQVHYPGIHQAHDKYGQSPGQNTAVHLRQNIGKNGALRAGLAEIGPVGLPVDGPGERDV